MAPGACRECGAKVSRKADLCPNCGVHFPTASNPVVALGMGDSAARKFYCRGAFGVLTAVVFGIFFLGLPLPR